MIPETILFYDTETTGMFDFGSGTHEPHQPHIVQLAWKLYHLGKCVLSESALIDSEWESHPEALAIHGKTSAIRTRFGSSMETVLNRFLADGAKADLHVAHNIAFDSKMIAREAHQLIAQEERHTAYTSFNLRPQYCTMLKSVQACRIPGARGFKWPKLIEAYRTLVDPKGFEGAHDALVDVEACAKIYFALNKDLPQ